MDVYPYLEKRRKVFIYYKKNHSFSEGNKWIVTTKFLFFSDTSDVSLIDSEELIDDRTLVALFIIIAKLEQEEKEMIISDTMNCIA